MDFVSNGNNNPASTIYIGNLDPRVNETMLHEIFATVGPVAGVKIITVRKYNQLVRNRKKRKERNQHDT